MKIEATLKEKEIVNCRSTEKKILMYNKEWEKKRKINTGGTTYYFIFL